MAYMIGDEGPYPHLPDEYCGNCGMEEYAGVGHYWNHRAGRPRPTKTQTIAELEGEKIVGLYLRSAITISDLKRIRKGVREVPTPPELLEPDASKGD